MKKLLPCLLLILGTGVLQASIVESITFDLTVLHTGSTLSGTFALSNSPMAGDTASALLSFSDPADYSASPLTATIRIGSGTMTAYTVGFDPIVFTNPSGNMFLKNVDLMPRGMAPCTSFPCISTGGFDDGSPSAFQGSYQIAPATAGVPEPGYAPLLLPILLLSFFAGRRVIRAK